MKMKNVLLPVLMAICLISCSGNPNEAAIRKAVERQMQTYPKSTLRDVYKNFFQDRFGPGHIISDTTAAGKYLRWELASSERFDGELYEPTGSCGNFYRVNLSLIKDGTIGYHTYFDAFVRSVNGITPPTVAEWADEWHEIVGVISRMNPRPSNFESDSVEIETLLKDGNYVMHHSNIFNETYSVHYRIIHRDIFEKEILPLIAEEKKGE